MGLRGDAAIVGIAEMKPERRPTGERMFSLEQWAELARVALDDAGIEASEVDGFVTSGPRGRGLRARDGRRVPRLCGQLR